MPYIAASGYRRLCEIGSQGGSNIDRLLGIGSICIDIVDPCIDLDLEAKYTDDPRVNVRKGLSLNVLPEIEGSYDCIMIDGDHNWYSVYHELTLIHQKQLLAPGGTVFLHDVCWPYARRDMYYDPENVPMAFRKPAAQRGILRGVALLSNEPGVGKNPELWNAVREGGARNGVLTAIEDFLQEHPNTYDFFSVRKEWGLGVLARKGENEPTFSRLRFRTVLKNGWEGLRRGVKRMSGRLEYHARR